LYAAGIEIGKKLGYAHAYGEIWSIVEAILTNESYEGMEQGLINLGEEAKRNKVM
jgi:hypothetical protein